MRRDTDGVFVRCTHDTRTTPRSFVSSGLVSSGLIEFWFSLSILRFVYAIAAFDEAVVAINASRASKSGGGAPTLASESVFVAQKVVCLS